MSSDMSVSKTPDPTGLNLNPAASLLSTSLLLIESHDHHHHHSREAAPPPEQWDHPHEPLMAGNPSLPDSGR